MLLFVIAYQLPGVALRIFKGNGGSMEQCWLPLCILSVVQDIIIDKTGSRKDAGKY